MTEQINIAGSLATLNPVDLTPHVGTIFEDQSVQLSDFLKGPDSEERIKDLATLIAHRGAAFFRNQDIDVENQKELVHRLGLASGKPKTSTLHKDPLPEGTYEPGGLSVMGSMGAVARAALIETTRASSCWHSDNTFEPVPADYTIVKMCIPPKVGGDILFASSYEAYDRLSPAFRKFLEGLTAFHSDDFVLDYAQKRGITFIDDRGSPENTGSHLSAVHPVIRTHPLTGYKSLFVNRTFTKRILELSPDESEDILNYLFRHVSENHDLQVRFRWTKNDVAIWDNRATFHVASNDYSDTRVDNRSVSIGERPFFDPASKSRREALGNKI